MDEEVEGSAVVLAYRSLSGNPPFNGTEFHSRYYIKQVNQLDMACGLLAGLHSIFNSDAELAPESILHRVKSGIEGKSPEEAAQCLLSNHELHSAHSAYAAEGQSNLTEAPDHHFISVLPGQVLYDGMKNSPIVLGEDGGFSLKFFQTVQNAIAAGTVGEDISLMVFRRVVN